MDSEERTLITLCIQCHLRVHRWRWFRHQVSAMLVQLWSELHAGAPVQFQLPLRTASGTDVNKGPYLKLEPSRQNLALGKTPSEQLFASSKPLVRQDDRLGFADGV